VDLRRVARYFMELYFLYRKEDDFIPILLVTDPSERDVPDRLVLEVEGIKVFEMFFVVVKVDQAFWEKWVNQPNRVTAVLCMLVRQGSPVEAALWAVKQILRAPGPIDDLPWLFKLVETFGKLTVAQRAEWLRRMQEDVEMTSVVDMIKTEGKAEGKAEGAALTILELVEDGMLTIAQATRKLNDLKAKGMLDAASHQDALQKLAGMQ
jgi:hypothetical protein